MKQASSTFSDSSPTQLPGGTNIKNTTLNLKRADIDLEGKDDNMTIQKPSDRSVALKDIFSGSGSKHRSKGSGHDSVKLTDSDQK